jgi:hypothetical protein
LDILHRRTIRDVQAAEDVGQYFFRGETACRQESLCDCILDFTEGKDFPFPVAFDDVYV